MGMLGQQQTVEQKSTDTAREESIENLKKAKKFERKIKRKQDVVKASCSVYQSDLQERGLSGAKQERLNPLISTYSIRTLWINTGLDKKLTSSFKLVRTAALLLLTCSQIDKTDKSIHLFSVHLD